MFSEMQSHPVVTRSSLEAMLDHLSKRENENKSMDLPPALPSRPLPRARLPPTKRHFPSRFGVCDHSPADDTTDTFLSGDDSKLGFELGGFYSGEIGTVRNGDLGLFDVGGSQDKHRLEEVGSLSFTDASLSCHVKCAEGIHSSVNKVIDEKFAKLQLQMSQMETTLDAKESKNIMLQEQLHRLESRLSEFETKTKAKEAMWHKQMESLQMALEAPAPAIVFNNTCGDDHPQPPTHSYESGSTSNGMETPVRDTPFGRAREPREGDMDCSNGLNVVDELVREFEEQKQVLEKGAEAIMELHSSDEIPQKLNSSGEDLQKLKHRFLVWNKEFKNRLKEAKIRLHKLNNTGDKGLRMLWCRKFPKM